MDIKDRIRDVITYSKLSVRQFALKCSLSQTTLNNQLLGKRELSLNSVEAILYTFPEISSEWLLRGTGPMLLSDSKEVRSENSNNKNTNINDSETLGKLLSMLEEKDKQINKLLELMKTK